MKKMDELDRSIQLHSEEWCYKAALLALSIWTLCNCWQVLMYDVEYNPLPSLILCLAISVQGFFQIAMKQKMVAGEEEYREPNRFLRTVLSAIVLVVLILSIGTYFLGRA